MQDFRGIWGYSIAGVYISSRLAYLLEVGGSVETSLRDEMDEIDEMRFADESGGPVSLGLMGHV